MMHAEIPDKPTLEARESKLDIWMYVGMALVLLGVIIETLPDFLRFEEWFEKAEHRVGGGLVAVGLLIEFVVDIQMRKCREKLKEITDRELAEITERAAKAEKAAAEANALAEQERLERINLEALIAPRRLTPEQRAVVVRGLAPFRGFHLAVETFNDFETQRFGSELIAAMEGAGLTVTCNTVSPYGHIEADLTFWGTNDVLPLATQLTALLVTVGVITPTQSQTRPSSQTRLHIGPKSFASTPAPDTPKA